MSVTQSLSARMFAITMLDELSRRCHHNPRWEEDAVCIFATEMRKLESEIQELPDVEPETAVLVKDVREVGRAAGKHR